MTGIYVPGTTETDPKKQNRSLQQLGLAAQTAKSDISTLQTTVDGLGPFATASLGQIPGDTSGTTAPGTGKVGQLVSSGAISGSPGSSGVSFNITSISVPAGVWDLDAFIQWTGGGATTISDYTLAISTTTASISTGVLGASNHIRYSGGRADWVQGMEIKRTRQLFTTTTTVFLNAAEVYTTGGGYINAIIEARRVS